MHAPHLSSPTVGGSTPAVSADDIRAAAGREADSARLHQLRRQQPEAYNVESQAHAHTIKKAGAHGFATGCSFVTIIFGLNRAMPTLPWRTMGLAAALPVGAAAGWALFSFFSAERRFYARERQREEWELRNYPDGEYDEMTAIYMAKGLSEADARHFVKLLSRDNQTFVDIMMVDELGYSCRPLPNNSEASSAAALAGSAFVAASVLPLLPRSDRVGPLVLAATVFATSAMQAKILYGAYADLGDSLRTLRDNTLWLSALGVVSFGAGCGIRALLHRQ
uniref:Uncharacterized protein n=1 Tax=Neobodo designis TaxID=312471 RepID=A0A6U4P8Z8_NEODS|mmetsp:Transcript_13034/g.40493  ORF Transcript_13034/g.40493 Transcript_13034/m.40493 type:complete len:279 (+) Transcript_13034:61-897(+)